MFQWKEEFILGIDIIDEQHKYLFEIGAQLDTLANTFHGEDAFSEIVVVIEKLVRYTEFHFKTEEEMMKKYNYPEWETHQIEHAKFCEYLRGLDFTLIDAYQLESIEKLLGFISRWISGHIAQSDFKYRRYID